MPRVYRPRGPGSWRRVMKAERNMQFRIEGFKSAFQTLNLTERDCCEAEFFDSGF